MYANDGYYYYLAMTCIHCGLPLWQHWFDGRHGAACCAVLLRFHRDLLPPAYLNQHIIYSHNPFVTPIFAGDGSSSYMHPLFKNALSKCPNQVRRHRLRPTGPHTHKEVLENYPGLFSLPSELDAMAKKLDKERKEVRKWATAKLKTQMLMTAHSLDLQWNGNRVSKFPDIAKSWVENNSDANAKSMYMIMFGDYEGINSAWSMNWEREYMEQNDREYMKEATKDRDKMIGCYQKQITISKIAQIKNFNKSFQVKIKMSVPKVDAGKRNGRRKKGDFYLLDITTVSLHAGK